MSAQIGLFAFALAVPLACAVGQQTSPQELEDSSAPAKVDSPSSRPHVRLGGVFIGAGYPRYSGYPSYGYYSGFWGRRPDFFDPFLFWPFAPGFTTGFVYQPNMGEVKIQTSNKTAWVYLDGAFAGRADHLRSMWLDPGVYNLEMRDGNRRYGQRIYVLTGKTLKLTPELMDQVGRP
jgi:hypothetical protein